MPIPTPNADESKDDFISRCSKKEYENLKDREEHQDKSEKKIRDMAVAICNDKWREHKS